MLYDAARCPTGFIKNATIGDINEYNFATTLKKESDSNDVEIIHVILTFVAQLPKWNCGLHTSLLLTDFSALMFSVGDKEEAKHLNCCNAINADGNETNSWNTERICFSLKHASENDIMTSFLPDWREAQKEG